MANQYLRFWRDDSASFATALDESMPRHLKTLRWLTRRVPVVKRLAERATHATLRRLAEGHRNSPRYWYLHAVEPRLQVFFGGRAAYEAIPGWDGGAQDAGTGEGAFKGGGVDARPDAPWRRLDHGYDEGQALLTLADLQAAAEYRGGRCLAEAYGGDVYTPLPWECALGLGFEASVLTVLHAGHWCPACDTTWNGGLRARLSPYFAQVWYADHGVDELEEYAYEGIDDIAGADEAWRRGRRGA